jgi:hypothetical protein
MRSIAVCLALSFIGLTGCYGPSSQPESAAQQPIALWQIDLEVSNQQPEQRVRLTDQVERFRASGWIGSVGIFDHHRAAIECGRIDSVPMPELPAQRFPVQVSRFDANTCSRTMTLCARGTDCSIAPGCPRLLFEASNATWQSIHSFEELNALSQHPASAMPDCFGLGGSLQARDCVDADLVEARRAQDTRNLATEVQEFAANFGEPEPPDLHLPADEARYLLTTTLPKGTPASAQSSLLLHWSADTSPGTVALAWTDNWPDPRQVPEQALGVVSAPSGWSASANASLDNAHALLRQSSQAPSPQAEMAVRPQRETLFDHSDYWFKANGSAPYRLVLFAPGNASCDSRSPPAEITRLAVADPASWQPATLGTLEELPVPATTQTQRAMLPVEREWRRWLKIAAVAWLFALGVAFGFRS